ncbi:MAG: UDP-3-O-(3-hydroxymyristoyl)glucosamine N-acyltransferase [Gammaproteobacteria bacterium]|nr:UDP-3-O-(3-hydroxymyristoyl)glucosamine N-acyltransferase [Gammaproteobacteria bacterium]
MIPTSPKIQFTLAELTKGLDVTVQGDSALVVTGIATITQALPHQITFLMNPRYKKYLAETGAAAVILTKDDSISCPVTSIISRDPYYTYAKIAAYFATPTHAEIGIHASAVVGQNCHIHKTASIGPHCVLGNHVTIGPNVVIGANCTLGDGSSVDEETYIDAGVTVYHEVIIKKRVHISSGTVIGSDGFGIAKHAGVWHKVPQLGRVIIEDDVEIGSNCSIDRGAIEDTVIGQGVKLDNLIQVGHNVRIGKHTAIAGCVAIAGSAIIGDNCLIGGGAGIGGHLRLADNVVITGMSAITHTIQDPGIYSSGAGGVVPNHKWRKNSVRLHHLDELVQRVKSLESVLKELTKE